VGGFELIVGIVPVVVIVIFIMATSVRILREYERAVIFRFGRRANAIFNPGGDGSGPGLILLIPLVDKLVKVSLRTVTMDVPPQDVITRDNVSVKVNAVIFFRVLDATKAVISVEDYLYATSQMAQTTLRSVLGQQELDDLLASRRPPRYSPASPSRSSSATCRPCVRSPRSGTPRPSSRSRWICSHPYSAPSAPRSRPRAELEEYRTAPYDIGAASGTRKPSRLP
jgi:hypothetical protein